MNNTAPATCTVTLDTPIKRGETEIASVALRRPMAGELRGLALTDLAKLDVNAVITLLPRISTPMLTSAEVAALSTADIFACAVEVGSFFLQKADLTGFPSA